MCGQVAIAVFPLDGGIRTGAAVPAVGQLCATVTAVALFDGLVTDATIVRASF